MLVYLSGGMKSDWQDRVIKAELGYECIDPRVTKEHEYEEEYTTWDLLGIKRADVVFAYMEKENPKGHGLCVEVGYAKALNKTIVFVDEYGLSAMGMVRAMADIVFYNLIDGIAYLQLLAIRK